MYPAFHDVKASSLPTSGHCIQWQMNEAQLEHLHLKFGELGPLNTDFPPLDQSIKGKVTS